MEGGNDEDETVERWTRGGHPLFAPDLVGVGILACSTCDYSGMIYTVNISHNMLMHD